MIKSDLEINKLDEITNNAIAILNHLNNIFNNYDSNSELSKFNLSKKNIKTEISPEFNELLKISKEYNSFSKGFFDVTFGKITSQLNYNNANVAEQEPIENNQCGGWSNLTFDYDNFFISKKIDCLEIDFGGIAEGYALKKIIDMMQKEGVDDALINFGGNITSISKNHKWKTYINEPLKEIKPFREINLNNQSISTSSLYGKFINYKSVKLSHIINPKTKKLKEYQNLSVSIISNNPVYSDALSTALISMSVDEMLEFISKNKIKAVILKKIGNKKTEIIYKTKGL